MKKFKLIKELLPVGTIINPEKDFAPTEIKLHGEHYQLLIGIGKDHTASLLIDADAVKENPDYFEEIE